ncbi:MAG: TonB-dependent receptor [Candidatus Ancaeobacter aquaticus]|nr:TonB-dependent receptor [Candidatus Ancaeobacter aquaticus]
MEKCWFRIRMLCISLVVIFCVCFSVYAEEVYLEEVVDSKIIDSVSEKDTTIDNNNAESEKNKETVTVLSPVIVTATRVEQSLADVPQRSTVISTKDCETPLVKSVEDVLRQSSDVRVSNFGGVGSPTSISIRGTNSNQSLYMIDGRPINSVNNGGFDFSKLPVESVDQIEIIRGPGSSLYGSNALGGVINIISKKPISDKPTVRTKTSYGGYNTVYQSGEHGWNLGKYGYYVSGNYIATDGYRTNGDYRGYNVSASAFFEPFDTFKMDYSFIYHQDNIGVPGPRPQEGVPAQYGTSEITSYVDRNKSRDFFSALKVTADPHEKVRVTSRFYYDFSKLRSNQRFAGLDPTTFVGITVDNDNTFDTYAIGTDFQVDLELFEGNTFSTGVDIRRESLRAWTKQYNLGTGDILTESYWKPHVLKRGVWLQDQWQIGEKLWVQAAIRYDWHTYFHSKWNPSAGLVYHITPTTQFKFSGGQSFRAPTFNDLFWPVGGNRDLQPEKGYSGEWGIDQQLCDKKVNVHAGIVAWYIRDKIQWFPDTRTGNWTPQNMNGQRLVGLELAMTWKPIEKLKLYCGYNWYRSRQVNSEITFSNGLITRTENVWRRAAFIPKHQIHFGASYVFPWKMKVDCVGNFRGDRVNYYSDWSNWPNVGMLTKKLGKIFTVDLTVSQELLEHADVYFLMKNLFNDEGSESFGTAFLDRNYPIMPFYVEAGVKVEF